MSTEKYCTLHDYEPPENSGFALCPKCELASSAGSASEMLKVAQANGFESLTAAIAAAAKCRVLRRLAQAGLAADEQNNQADRSR